MLAKGSAPVLARSLASPCNVGRVRRDLNRRSALALCRLMFKGKLGTEISRKIGLQAVHSAANRAACAAETRASRTSAKRQ
jgi:hypothetical protein